jgi:hypothetical protein
MAYVALFILTIFLIQIDLGDAFRDDVVARSILSTHLVKEFVLYLPERI